MLLLRRLSILRFSPHQTERGSHRIPWGGTSLYWISYESPLDEVVSFEVTDAAVESIGMEDDEWGVSAITVSHEGESFIRVNGEWHDMSLEATADMLGAEGLFNNCCLKGFYVTTQ